jgi:hypothetical protein
LTQSTRNIMVWHAHQHSQSQRHCRLLSLHRLQYIHQSFKRPGTYHRIDLIDSLTVDRGKLPGSVLKHKVLQSVLLLYRDRSCSETCRMGAGKSHILYCDISLNSSFAVHLNIYENFLMTGMKMVQYLKDRTSCMEAQPDFIIGTLMS